MVFRLFYTLNRLNHLKHPGVAVPGIQNVILVGVGAGDDWQQVGLATGPELQKFEGKVALAWSAQLRCCGMLWLVI
jgi:hypothetical protein